VLRVGRTTAYRLARTYLATNGADGIPTVRYGKQLRVPRAALERDLGGPITWPLDVDPAEEPAATAQPQLAQTELPKPAVVEMPTSQRQSRSKRAVTADQIALPFPA